jgi:hypothetical protein
MKTMSQLMLLIAAGSLVACTWVKPETGADAVALRAADDLIGCELVSQTTVSVRDRVAGVQRSAAKVQEELDTLARNSAVDVGGDVIVREERIEEGKQRYGIYRCSS